ncbi:CPBP family intramembrane glutamic endopeptidase [Nocardioides jiangxiensis]|uniref:Type II CAAX endopeptidase family protein n=1 Tax=Nocardioides jiangxiensis TaxID=3064524 RepID=A0ABT9B4A3_9ACTN|nr:type II CAAX endopeptidase family protein [Nocardioides sp. WY-20]MDO7869144.1 type II CAAX endopeptidase family protein [Nocardioides sp. WY-20]
MSTTAGTGLGYHQLQRSGPRAIWRPVLGAVALLVGMVVLANLITAVAALVDVVVTGGVPAGTKPLDDPGPVLMAGILLGLSASIPLALALARALHGLRPGFVVSVAGRIRWRYLGGCLGMAVVAMIATMAVASLVPSGTRAELTATPHPFDGRMLALLVTVGLLTPFQGAAEEVVFRGYLTQAVGSIFPTAVAVVFPALVFAVLHGFGQSWPVFTDRFAFGLVAGMLVVLTGGLEAGIAMHVVNNWLAFGFAIVSGNLGEALQPTDGTWWSLPGTLTQSLVYLGLAVWLARRQGLATRTGVRWVPTR